MEKRVSEPTAEFNPDSFKPRMADRVGVTALFGVFATIRTLEGKRIGNKLSVTIRLALLITLSIFTASFTQPGGVQTDKRGLKIQPAEQKESRLALVIGNGAYKDAPLQNPVN